MDDSPRTRFRSGLAAGVPFAIAGGILSMSFGILATAAGMPGIAAVVMSVALLPST